MRPVINDDRPVYSLVFLLIHSSDSILVYLFGLEVFLSKTNFKNLDLSYKMTPDFRLFGIGNPKTISARLIEVYGAILDGWGEGY